MSINETVARRMSFPLTRGFVQRAVLLGAVMANAMMSEYIQTHVEPDDEVIEDTPLPGMYL